MGGGERGWGPYNQREGCVSVWRACRLARTRRYSLSVECSEKAGAVFLTCVHNLECAPLLAYLPRCVIALGTCDMEI